MKRWQNGEIMNKEMKWVIALGCWYFLPLMIFRNEKMAESTGK